MNNKKTDKSLTVLQVNTRDTLGGAEKIAWELFQGYRSLGLRSWLAVGHKKSDDPNVLVIPNNAERNGWVRFWRGAGDSLNSVLSNVRGAGQLRTLLYGIGQPQWWVNIQRGREDFDFPGTWRLLELLPQQPDIVHCHNLHGEYFDLRVLPWLSQQVPVVITLHDSWLLTGHCAYSLDCDRWQTGCGRCPYLKIYPAIPRDATTYNWQRKQDIFSKNSINIATPSSWLMEKVQQSMLAPAVKEARVIPNGMDLSLFRPIDKRTARSELGISPNVKMLLFVAASIRHTYWKDYETIQAVVTQVSENSQQDVIFIALGGESSTKRIGQAEVRFVPFQKNPEIVARYYQAADVYLHAAHVDNFPNAVLEALACGTPVVATAVGGISEQVKSLELVSSNLNLKRYHPVEATGVLVSARNANEMAMAVEWLLNDETLRIQLSKNAARDARNRFDLDQQVDAYLEWYQEIINRENGINYDK